MMITKAQIDHAKDLKIWLSQILADDKDDPQKNIDFIEALSALIAVGEKLADQTHVVVPVEPTEEMRIAALNTQLPSIDEPPLYEKIYHAMIAAAK